MSQELVISSNPIETAVAVLEDDRLVEVHVEHHARKALTGSIYKGRVTRVLPGMQSAFVNLGLQRDAFLYVTDVLDPSEGIGEDLDAGPIKAEPIPPLRTAKKDSGKSPGPAKSGAADGGSGQAGRVDQIVPPTPTPTPVQTPRESREGCAAREGGGERGSQGGAVLRQPGAGRAR